MSKVAPKGVGRHPQYLGTVSRPASVSIVLKLGVGHRLVFI